jgi:hypothetical protein
MLLVLSLFWTANESVGGHFKEDSVLIDKLLVRFSHSLCLLPLPKFNERIIRQSHLFNYAHKAMIHEIAGYRETLRAATR